MRSRRGRQPLAVAVPFQDLPEEAIIPRGEEFYVYIVEEGKAVLKKVELGQRMAGKVEIREGLDAGVVVVTAGHHRVSNGFPVRVRSQEEAPGGKTPEAPEPGRIGEGN